MAYFRLRTDAQAWFSKIIDKAPFRTKFDVYYLCLLAGLANERATELSGPGNQATDLVEKFVSDYRPASRLVIGLLITVELRKNGIEINEKKQVRTLIKRLIDSESPNTLTDMGMKRLNAYASGGYDFLAEQRDVKPYNAEEFLQGFMPLIEKAVQAASES